MGFSLQIIRRLFTAKMETFHHIRVRTHVSGIAASIHTETREPKSAEMIKTVCDLLRRGGNWDSMSRNFASMELTDSLVEKVLLELQEPIDAKRALSFFHWSARGKNYEHSIGSYCMTIQILVRARMLMDARAMLESVIRKNFKDGSSRFVLVESLLDSYKNTQSSPFLFDFLIQTYSKLRMFEMAFDASCYLEEHGFSSSLISFNTLIHLVQKSGKIPLVWKIYEFMIQKRTYPDENTIKIMIDALCKEGKLQKFIDISDRIHGKRCSPVVIVNTSLVFRILEEERIEEGVVLLKRLLQKNMILDDVAYSLIVYAKFKIGSLESTEELLDEMLKRGFHANSFLYTLFIGAHCKEGRIDEANQLMQEMKNAGLKPYDVTFNFLIEGCTKAGKSKKSLSICEEMIEKGFFPSCSTFNKMVEMLCGGDGDVKQANAILTTLLDKGFLPNEETYSYLMDAYGREGDIQEVLKLYYEIEYRVQSPGLLVYKALIRSLCQCRKLKEAEKYLMVMQDRSLVPTADIYDMLVAGYCEKGDTARAFRLYDQMAEKELKLSSQTFTALMDGHQKF